MPFPESPRVIYEQNPIIEVICQISYPAILKIDSEVPTTFQEKIRKSYPIYTATKEAGIKISFGNESNESPTKNDLLNLGGNRSNFRFSSEDNSRSIILTRDFLAFTTTIYRTWQDFKIWFEPALTEFIQEYEPLFFSRLGLRYKDLIVRSELDLEENESWKDLLNPPIAGELSDSDLANEIVGQSNQTIFRINNGVQIVLNHGLVNNQSNEQCYLIDSDFSTSERTEVNNAFTRLGDFNKMSGSLFRWCISRRLHEALKPHNP